MDTLTTVEIDKFILAFLEHRKAKGAIGATKDEIAYVLQKVAELKVQHILWTLVDGGHLHFDLEDGGLVFTANTDNPPVEDD